MQAQSTQQNSNKVQTIALQAGAVIAGDATYRIAKKAAIPVIKPIAKNLIKLSVLKDDEIKIANKAINKALTESGLEQKGVIIDYISKSRAQKNISKIEEKSKNIEKNLEKSKNPLKDILFILKKKKLQNHWKALGKGVNASFLPRINKIRLPEHGMRLAAFHEMGHAMNKHSSKLGAMIQKNAKKSRLLNIPILAIGLIKKPKKEDEQSKSNLGQTTDFIKKHAPLLVGATSIPLLYEEGMANIKGSNLAKKTLNSNLYKKVLKANKLSFATYALGTATTMLGTFAAIKVRDKVGNIKINK